MTLKKTDNKIFNMIQKEKARLTNNLELIASENIVHESIYESVGSVLTNKYAEGYPGKRYYGGCRYVDEIEQIAIDRAKSLFNAEAANVQPHSGSNANMAAYMAFLKPKDKILSMNLSEGGHLTHGSGVNFSGKLYKVISYGVDKKTCRIDYKTLEKLAVKHKPKIIVAGATAYSRRINFKKFKSIAKKVNALLMVDMAHFAGTVAAGLYDNPVKYADVVTSTTHKTLRGPRGGLILMKDDHKLAINKSIFPGIQGGPLVHAIAGKAVCFKLASQKKFIKYQQQILDNAKIMSETLKQLGFKIVSGGTDTHLFIIDLRNKNITGKEFEALLEKVNITVNKNTIPYDPESPFVTSGIRIGTPAVTSRGMKKKQMEMIAEYIADTLKFKDENRQLKEIKNKVLKLTGEFLLEVR